MLTKMKDNISDSFAYIAPLCDVSHPVHIFVI